MSELRRWTEADFEQMSWHDNHVHGIQIRAGEYGSGELILDLDYIVEWLCAPDGSCRFRIAPADLTFHGIYDLKFSLDYAAVTAAITPFSIYQITREPGTPPGTACKWHIEINWPKGSMVFSAHGYSQVLRSEPMDTGQQMLSSEERQAAGRG